MIKIVFYGFLLTFALADEVADKFEENEVNPDVVTSAPSALLKVIQLRSFTLSYFVLSIFPRLHFQKEMKLTLETLCK